eukprot:12468584-Alexandrium_andersonii.AAC.1
MAAVWGGAQEHPQSPKHVGSLGILGASSVLWGSPQATPRILGNSVLAGSPQATPRTLAMAMFWVACCR